MPGPAPAPRPPVPVVDLGPGTLCDLYFHERPRAAALLDACLGVDGRLRAVAPLGDAVARHLFRRWNVPYRAEIQRIARDLHRPGAWLMNAIYEFGCSTGAAMAPATAGDPQRMRMLRLLDWNFPGLGRYLVVTRRHAVAGTMLEVTWPGYVGALTVLAPGRFAVALNQAPVLQIAKRGGAVGRFLAALPPLGRGKATPAAFLLRHVAEHAASYAEAVAMLLDPDHDLVQPALLTVCGLDPGEACVIDGFRRMRAVTSARADRDGGAVAVTNDWRTTDPAIRARAAARRPPEHVRTDCAARRDALLGHLTRPLPADSAQLGAPLINRGTRLFVAAEPATGRLWVQGLEPPAPGQPGEPVTAMTTVTQPMAGAPSPSPAPIG